MRLVLALALATGSAATVLFATLPWVGTRSRAWRLAPHLGPAPEDDRFRTARRSDGREAILAVGTALSRLVDRVVGILEPLDERLDRIHRLDDPAGFRFRQGAVAVSVTALAAAVVLVLGPPPVATPVILFGPPLAAALALELELTVRGRRWSLETRWELPVIGEQLVALLRAGRSPTAALEQVAAGEATPLRTDLIRVVDHLRRGGGLDEALGRWADRSDVDAVHRLTRVLSLHHRTPDLAELMGREVDATRDELHRDLLAEIDRRSQQVWIPVTVAALIPGAIFLLVPFFDALRLFGATT